MKIVIGILLVAHGFINAMQSSGSFKPTGGIANPGWLNWWPVPMGQSWLLARLGIERSFAGTLAGILWLAAGAALIAAGLGLFRFVIPTAWWRPLAGIGAGLSLLMLILYANPMYAVGIGANLAVLIVLLWAQWPSPEVLGG